MTRLTRRTVVRGSAGALTLSFIAGCTGDDDDDDAANDLTPEEVAVEWASDAHNFDDEGDIADHTGEDEVEVENGGTANGNYTYEPAVVRIDEGATVNWVWTSPGHTVTLIPSEGATLTDWDEHDEEEGEGFEHAVTFDEAGVALYECRPHRADPQRGAVIVE